MGESGEAQASPPAAELIDFTLERGRHRRFVGRDDVLARLDEWLLGPDDTGWVVVTGGPGMGKSAILAKWLDRREAAGAAVPHHFVRRQVIDWDQPERIAASLAAQIEAMFPEHRDVRAKPEGRLPELLGRVSKHLGASGRLVIVVDGLDETRAEPGENPLPRFLPHVVPAGIRILCATRPTYPHLGWIEARSPARRVNLDDDQWASSNEAVVRGFWEAVGPDYQPPLPASTVAVAIARAEGNVLYAVMLHDVLRDLPPEQRRAERIPAGLRHLVGEMWDRAASAESVRAGLGLLCAAQEALSLDALAEVAGWSYDAKERFIRHARQLLLEEPASWAGAEAYRPRHDWVRELMAERVGGAALRAHHETLARALARWPSAVEPTARRYALRHALIHRVEARAWTDAWRLAADMSFLEAKCRELGTHEAEFDVGRVAERCRASGDEAHRERFGDLTRALARESHWLRAAPEATAAQVWNRLRQLGWSADEIDQQLQLPADSRFLRVRHVATRESAALVRDLVGHAGRVSACAVTPDGRRVVSASDDRTLKVWDLATGRVEATLEGHADIVTACAVTPDGRRVVSASRDRTLKVWDLVTGRAEATLEGHARKVTGCAVTLDGRRVVSTSEDTTLKVWDLTTGRAEATLEGHTEKVTACAVIPDGRVVSLSEGGTLNVWDLASERAETALEGHAWESPDNHDTMTTCAVMPDGQRVVVGSYRNTLKVWNLRIRRAVRALAGHASAVTACAVTPDGRRVVSASEDHTLKVWDLGTEGAEATLEGHVSAVTACAVTPDGRWVVSASEDHTLKVWDLATRRAEAALEGHASVVTACVVTPDGRRVVSASVDGTLKVWDLATGRAEATLEGDAGWVACAVTPDGRQVVSASGNATLKVWDLATGRAEATLGGHVGQVTGCAVTPDGRRVVSTSEDKTLKVWDLASRRPEATLEGHADRVTGCAVMPDGRRVVSVSEDKTLKVWDLATGRAEATLEDHAGWVACAVTPDGQRVVSASKDRTLKVWDLATGRVEATLRGHAGGVTACAVTPDGRRVVSASGDGTLRVWDLQAGACILTHRANATCRAIAATATAIIAGDAAGAVWFLDWPSPDARRGSAQDDRWPDNHPTPSSDPEFPAQTPPMQHTIRSLAANPLGTDRVALDREARAIQVERGCAAMGLQGLTDHDRPKLAVRAGIDAGKLVLAADPVEAPASQAGMDTAGNSPASRHRPRQATPPQVDIGILTVRAGIDAGKLVLAADPVEAPASQAGIDTAGNSPASRHRPRQATPPQVDIGILTIRDDEFRAVLQMFPTKAGTIPGAHREYTLRHAEAGDGERYTITVLRQAEHGLGEAQTVARDLIEDLAPRLVLVVGIAGGLPSDDITLGDVVLSTRIHDFTVEARKAGQEVTYAATGGPMNKALANAVADLANREGVLGNWTADLPARPPVIWRGKGQLEGPPEWQRELRAKLKHHHGKGATLRAPVYAAGPIASSDRLVRDPAVLIPWLTTARNLLAIETESGGVYRAVRERCPMLAIRGISDIIGLKRSDAWTKYACASAAAFTRAFLRTHPIELTTAAGSVPPAASYKPDTHSEKNGLLASRARRLIAAGVLAAAVVAAVAVGYRSLSGPSVGRQLPVREKDLDQGPSTSDFVPANPPEIEWAQWKMPNPSGTDLPNPAKYDVSGHGIVRDEMTGLTWQRDPAPDKQTWARAVALCRQLELDGGGWRLPTFIELYSLVNYNAPAPTIDRAFHMVPSEGDRTFWTSTPAVESENRTWVVQFSQGDPSLRPPNEKAFVRCVRSTKGGRRLPQQAHFKPNENRTVTDLGTQLIWQQKSDDRMYNQQEAVEYCKNLDLAGISWRLPSVKELMTLIDRRRRSPAADPALAIPATMIWTSSGVGGSTQNSWTVNFDLGTAPYDVVTNRHLVLCVH